MPYGHLRRETEMSVSESVAAFVNRKGIRNVLGRLEPVFLALQEAHKRGPYSSGIRIPYGRHSYGPQPIVIGPHPYVERLSAGSRVGSFCSISPGLRFVFRGKHRYDWISTYPFYEFHDRWGVDEQGWKGGVLDIEGINPAPIVVGNDVWIAANVSIKQGVTIGDGAVLAMESLITKDVPPYALVGGNPARVLKYRFQQDQVEELLKIAWWNWPDEKIIEIAPMLVSDDIDGFIRVARKMRNGRES